MSVSYPTDFPIAEALDAVSIVRNGEVVAKKAAFAHDLWVVEGFGLKSAFGDPNAATAHTAPANFNAVDELEKLALAHKNNAVVAQSNVPWGDILKWALQELLTVLATA